MATRSEILTFVTRLGIESRSGALVLLAVRSGPDKALLQLAGILDGRVALAALAGDRELGHLDQVVGQKLAPGGQHGSDVLVSQLGLDVALQLLNNQLGVGQGVGALGAPGLAHAVGVVGLQQALEDVAAGTPLAVGHIVALGSRLAVLARRADVVLVSHTALSVRGGAALGQGAGTLGAQGIDGGIFQVLGNAKGQTGSAEAPGNSKERSSVSKEYKDKIRII